MGKKTKIGKQRKDKFYQLAKETGYRSRASFKLLQLNRKFEFLQKSRVLVDLCAAPGGWMQAAVQNMPVSSLVIGVDLYPIKPIPGCTSFQGDITTQKCIQDLKKELKTWKADVVLNDGAPNVGQNWIHDAYQQNCLTLSALKVATEVLREGGYFVTKVFRSKDYNSLVWVFQQLFKNVFSTKPAASRSESAEIFVVCKGYLAPSTIDPKFLDPKYAFEEIELTQNKKQLQQLLKEIGKKKKAEGYPSGETLLYKPVKASDFVNSSDHIELLSSTSEIIIDEEWIEKNPATTQDIKDYCNDVRVIGKKETKALIQWRKVLKEKWEQFLKLKSEGSEPVKKDKPVEEQDDDPDSKLEEAIEELKENQRKEEKRKKKKFLKEVKKLQEKKSLDMIIPGDSGPTDTMEDSLFNLKNIKSNEEIDTLTQDPEMPEVNDGIMDDDEEIQFYEEKRRNRIVRYNKEEQVLDDSGTYYRNINDIPEPQDESNEKRKHGTLGLDSDDDNEETLNEESIEDFEEDSHPLLTDLDPRDKNVKKMLKAQRWFEKDIFKDLNIDASEDIEIDRMAKSFVEKGAIVPGCDIKEANVKPGKSLKQSTVLQKETAAGEEDDLEVVNIPKKRKKLDVEELALASVMVQSQKSRRDLIDEGWNRYAFNDEGLPDWFIEDEKKHMKKTVVVPPELEQEYRNSLQEINARPIKKVVEAKARKKKRALKKLEKAKKKADAILEKGELTEQEKANQIKQLYKKAKQTKKKEVTYVVSKKATAGKRIKRPAGVKGPMKVVDPRMKKDNRRLKNMTKTNKKKFKNRMRSTPRSKGKKH